MRNRFETLFQFVGWVCLDDPSLRGLGFPRSQARGADTWYPLGVYPNTHKIWTPRAISRGQTIGASSPYLDGMMMTNVRQFQIRRFPNDKRFQTKLCEEVVNSVSKLWVTQKDGVWLLVTLFRCHCPMMSKGEAKETVVSQNIHLV